MGTNGTAQLTICYCSRVLELAKGLDAVRLATTDDSVSVLEQIKTAAEQGKMGEMIASVGNKKTC